MSARKKPAKRTFKVWLKEDQLEHALQQNFVPWEVSMLASTPRNDEMIRKYKPFLRRATLILDKLKRRKP